MEFAMTNAELRAAIEQTGTQLRYPSNILHRAALQKHLDMLCEIERTRAAATRETTAVLA